MREDYGDDPSKWPGRPGAPEAWPASTLTDHPGDRILLMTGDDAFTSSNLRFVLRNLEIRNLILIGGPVETMLARTTHTAKQRDFRTLFALDAVSATRESERLGYVADLAPDYAVQTSELLRLMESAAPQTA